MASKVFIVTLKRSLIGFPQDQRDAARVLGLRKIGQKAEIKDNPASRGNIFKLQHMLSVEVK